MAKKMQKTNAMRLLDARKVAYTIYEYPHGETALPGDEVAQLIGKPQELVYKTRFGGGNSGMRCRGTYTPGGKNRRRH